MTEIIEDICTDCIDRICKQTGLSCEGNYSTDGSVCLTSPNLD